MTNKLFILPFLALGLVGCSDRISSSQLDGHRLTAAKIYSDRPITEKSTFSIIKLKSPALLTVAAKENGELKIPEAAVKQVNLEHEKMIEKLAALSSEIRVLYQYKLVLNAIALVVPVALEAQVNALEGVVATEGQVEFAAPLAPVSEEIIKNALDVNGTSVSFIEADQLHAQGIRGQGMRLGVIDTGIDFTHSMLAGPGTAASYQAVNPAQASALFPNKKVVGGIDLVGTKFNTSSPIFANRVPVPDNNPLDEQGHGTHVAGTIAGIGDGTNSYDGVAPDADLYAIKVFGSTGSTSSLAVVAALEFAADPDGDLDPKDRLHAVNLSLGGGSGKPGDLYSQAIDHLTQSGTIVIASAGNSGDVSYIVGSPSTANSAISIAASIDGMSHNWQFDATSFDLGEEAPLVVETTEGSTTKPIDENLALTGKLVHIGLAAVDLTTEQVDALKGNIALVDRGEVAFDEKIKRAQDAGALGVVAVNNAPGAPIVMGGTGKFDIPGLMISQTHGDVIKAKLALGQDVVVKFRHEEPIKKPELIDTLTSFSSRGPRSYDSAIKPEISAPGQQIISAARGGGDKVTRMNGTSMSAPHMAGVMGLMRQLHPTLSAEALKSIVMGTAKTLTDTKGEVYSVAYQGAGRVQVAQAAKLDFYASPASLSLGEMGIMSQKTIRRKLTLTNLSADALILDSKVAHQRGLEVKAPTQVTIPAQGSTEITVQITLNSQFEGGERDAFLEFSHDDKKIHIPMLAVTYKLSDISAPKLAVYAGHERESAGAAADLTLKNSGTNAGDALIFNLIGNGQRRTFDPSDLMQFNCNLQSAGYRLIEKDGEQVLQFAVKLFGAINSWEDCEVAVLVDGDNDGVHDQELAGTMLTNIAGVTATDFASVLLDAKKIRELRLAYETAVLANPALKPNYVSAVVDDMEMKVYQQSTLAVVSVKTAKLAKTAQGQLRFKLAVLHNYLGDDNFLNKDWTNLNLSTQDAPYLEMPEVVTLAPQSEQTIQLTKGLADGQLVIYAPDNARSQSTVINDQQQILVAPLYTP